MNFIKKHKAYLFLSLVMLVIGYFFIQNNNDKVSVVDGWTCPEEDVEINLTLAYMAKINDVDGVFKIIDFLKSQGCDIALQKIQARMSADIEAGKSPGSEL